MCRQERFLESPARTAACTITRTTSERRMTDLLTNPEFWQYLSIPVIAALIGWSTNWLAIKMTFYPLEFIGKPPLLGWQGIIFFKARKMAAIRSEEHTSELQSRPH